MKQERYEALKRVAAPDSGATDNERSIALALIAAADKLDQFDEETKTRIRIRNSVSSGGFLVTRIDGKRGCSVFTPVEESVAIKFIEQSLKMKLNRIERRMICEKVNS